MLTKRESTLSKTMIVIQTIIAILSFWGLLYNNVFSIKIVDLILIFIIIAIVWGYLLYRLNLGVIFREVAFPMMIRGYATVGFIGTSCLLAIAIAHPWMETRWETILFCLEFGIFNVILLITFKYLFYRSMRFIRRKGYNTRNIIIIGDQCSQRFLSTFDNVKDWGYKLLAIFSEDDSLKQQFSEKLFVDLNKIETYIIQNPVDDVFYCLPINKNNNISKIIEVCNTVGITLHIMQHSDENIHGRYALKAEFNENFITYQTVSDKYLRLKIKELFDLLFSLTVIVASAPVTLLIALLIKVDGGSVLFKQERIGRNGRRFVCYKFRSMVPNAEELKGKLTALNEADGPAFKIKDDPRITKIGKFLRKTSLDELPQFINVVLGDMSIVGPRPPLLSEVEQYEPHQLRRLSMKPGITCTWQVWGRHNVSFEDWIKMDLEYIDNWSIRLDAKIIISTFGVILKAGNN